ncbi:MAG: hypothetical protein IKU26_06695 [Clostridia bacterium]|nr:hypothetical protein [Clostridia bacterium]
MKRLVTFMLAIMMISSLFLCKPYQNKVFADEKPSLTVQVNSNNEIVVSWKNVSLATMNSPSVSVQLRRESSTSALAYHYVYNTSASNPVDNGTSGSVTFSDQYAGDEGRKANFPLENGDYYVILRLNDGTLKQDTRVDFHVGPKPTLTLETLSFAVGNHIRVSWKDVSKDIMESPSVAIQLRHQSDTGSGKALAYHYVYNTTINNGEEGSVTFSNEYAGSDDRKANFPLAPGEYYVILRLNDGSLEEETRVDFTVEPTQKIAMEKTVFKYGESIPVNYSGMSGVANVAIRVYHTGYTVGVSGSEAYVTMTDASGNALHGESGTLSFMADDERPADASNKVHFLQAGTYEVVMVIIGKNEVFGKTVAFEVTDVAGKIMAAAPELKESITVHYIAHIDRTIPAEDVSMKFIFKGETFTVAGIPGETLGNKIVYTFPLEDILPQDLAENISAELYAGEELLDSHTAYSVQQYCVNMLANTTSETLKVLLVSLLNYGAEAQKYFTGTTENLMNEVLTESQRGYVSNVDMKQIEGVVATPVDATDNTGAYVWKAATLGLYDTVQIRVKFYAETTEGLAITANGTTYTDFVSIGNYLYYVYIPVYADCFAEKYTICFQNAKGLQGATLTYSVNTYISYIANQESSSATDIAQAICNYGTAAQNYVLTY